MNCATTNERGVFGNVRGAMNCATTNEKEISRLRLGHAKSALSFSSSSAPCSLPFFSLRFTCHVKLLGRLSSRTAFGTMCATTNERGKGPLCKRRNELRDYERKRSACKRRNEHCATTNERYGGRELANSLLGISA